MVLSLSHGRETRREWSGGTKESLFFVSLGMRHKIGIIPMEGRAQVLGVSVRNGNRQTSGRVEFEAAREKSQPPKVGVALARHLHAAGTFAWTRGLSAWGACVRQGDQGPPGTCGEEGGTLLGAHLQLGRGARSTFVRLGSSG